MKMRDLTMVVATGSLVAALAGCAGGGNAPAPGAGAPGGGGAVAGDVAKGKEVFASTCASCHGMDAKGMPSLGKNLVDKTEWMKKQNDAALVAFLKKGRPVSDPENTTKVDMPPKGGNPALTDDDINNVVVYIRSIQKK